MSDHDQLRTTIEALWRGRAELAPDDVAAREAVTAAIDLLDEDLNAFLTNPDVLQGGLESVESIADTGDFEIEFADAFSQAKG